MNTDTMNVTVGGLSDLSSMASEYDEAIADLTDPAEILAAAESFCDGSSNTAAVMSADGSRVYNITVVPPGSQGTGDNLTMTIVRAALDEVVSVCRQLAESPQNIANDLQANVTSADGQYQMQFMLVAG